MWFIGTQISASLFCFAKLEERKYLLKFLACKIYSRDKPKYPTLNSNNLNNCSRYSDINNFFGQFSFLKSRTQFICMKMKMSLECWCLDILCILLSNAASSPFSRWYPAIQAIMIRVYLLLCRQAYLVTSYWCMQCNMPAAHLMYHSAVPMSYTRNNYWFSIQRLWWRSPYLRSNRDVIWQGDNIVTS